jgi:hypothetical protein
MYPRIPWELVADPLCTAEHTLGTTALEYLSKLYRYSPSANAFPYNFQSQFNFSFIAVSVDVVVNNIKAFCVVMEG